MFSPITMTAAYQSMGLTKESSAGREQYNKTQLNSIQNFLGGSCHAIH